MANENKPKSKKNFFSRTFSILKKPIGFMFMPVTDLIKCQVGNFVQDFKEELGKKAVALLFFVLGFLFVYTFFLFLSVLIVVALYEFAKLKLFYAILIVMGLDLLLIIISFIIGKVMFKSPIFNDSSKRLEKK